MVHTPAGARAHTRPRLTRVFVLQLSKGRARVISKYEMDKALSERGSLILYLDKVTPPPPVSTWRRFSFRRVFSQSQFPSRRRFLTEGQKKSPSGSTRSSKLASYNQLLCPCTNTMTVSFRDVNLESSSSTAGLGATEKEFQHS